MTDKEIKDLKIGDTVRVYAPFVPPREYTITGVRRGQGTMPTSRGHYYAVIEFTPGEGDRRDYQVIESDEYILGVGLNVTTPNGQRLRGAELLTARAEAVQNPFAGYGGWKIP